MRLRRKPKFRPPDERFRLTDVDVMVSPDEPLELVIVQGVDQQGRVVHLTMEKGMAMMMLLRGSQALRVDIGLTRAGDLNRWSSIID